MGILVCVCGLCGSGAESWWVQVISCILLLYTETVVILPVSPNNFALLNQTISQAASQ